MKHIQKTALGRKLSIDVEDDNNGFVSLATKTPASEKLKDLIASSWQGMKSGRSPTLCEVGVGGTYFMKDPKDRIIGVFKPHDEEMGCQNNPKGFTPNESSLKKGIVGGGAAFRECAAYVLDHDHLAGVPATDLVACSYPCFHTTPEVEENIKIGSFQEYKEHDFDADDISPLKASRFPVAEVHKIAILDIRLFNTDRHGGNILVRKLRTRNRYDEDCDSPRPREYGSDADENGLSDNEMQFRMEGSDSDSEDLPPHSLTSSTSSYDGYGEGGDDDATSYELIPIDHGYTLPYTISGLTDLWFEWLNWPQAKVPFNRNMKDYIARLDAESDVSLLRQKFGDWIQTDCYKVLRITTMWLKIGAKYNLTPYDIGVRMCRRDVDVPSELEQICWEAEDSWKILEKGENNKDVSKFFVKLEEIMEKKVIEIAKMGTPLPRKLTF